MIITKDIIEANKAATRIVADLEKVIQDFEFNNTDSLKAKAEFGNFIVMLKGARLVKEATEALLQNNDILISPAGEYFQKVDDINTTENTESEDVKAPESNA